MILSATIYRRRRLASLVACFAIFAPGASKASAATFGPITGTLQIAAGMSQSAPAAIGTTSLIDSTPPEFADASLTAAIFGASQFSFVSSAHAVIIFSGTSASGSLTFNQPFITASQQWIQLSANVLSPPGDPGAVATLKLAKTGQANPVFSLGHTNGAELSSEGLFAAGTFTVEGAINTAATALGAKSGAISGFVLITPLADYDGNLTVGAGDFPTIRTNFGPNPKTFATGDVTGDGFTDGRDMLLFQRQLGTRGQDILGAVR
jgi:hypothetical protein